MKINYANEKPDLEEIKEIFLKLNASNKEKAKKEVAYLLVKQSLKHKSLKHRTCK